MPEDHRSVVGDRCGSASVVGSLQFVMTAPALAAVLQRVCAVLPGTPVKVGGGRRALSPTVAGIGGVAGGLGGLDGNICRRATVSTPASLITRARFIGHADNPGS
jgi:hypothetical protein